MFELLDIISIGIILIIIFFLFILFQIEKSFTKPRVYLRAALFFALFILILEELIVQEQYGIALWFYPLIISAFFIIYPLIYIYSRSLIFDGGNEKVLKYIFPLPAAVFIYVSYLFYPLDYNAKILFMTLHLSESSSELKGFTTYQYLILISYYIQTAFYVGATLKLTSHIRKKTSKPWELLVVKYISFYVVIVIAYEISVAGFSIFFSEDIKLVKILENIVALLFVSFGLFIAFKQSLIIMQSKIYKYTGKLPEKLEEYDIAVSYDERSLNKESGEELLVSVRNRYGGNNRTENAQTPYLLEPEKNDIKEAVEGFFNESKIYLNPNLKLEYLAKKIHIPVRKISMVINEVYGNNFNHFINEYRISEVKKIIAKDPGNTIIEDIYSRAGFNSRSSFNRVFKEFTGLSPIDYVRSLSENRPEEVPKLS